MFDKRGPSNAQVGAGLQIMQGWCSGALHGALHGAPSDPEPCRRPAGCASISPFIPVESM